MKGSWLVIMMVALMLASCQQELPPTPTTVPMISPPPLEVDTVSPVRLVRNPRAFEGKYVLLSGRYKPHPPLICRSESFLSPATWDLVAGEVEIPASGSDNALRTLDDGDLVLELIGLWKRWSGQVGCGRDAPIRHLWYLEVTEIISPNPIVVAGGSGEGEADQENDLTPEQEPAEGGTPVTLTAEAGDQPSPETPSPPPVETAAVATRTVTAAADGEETPPENVTRTPVITPDLTSTASSEATVSATAQATDAVETPTPTATTAPNPTPTTSEIVAGSIAYDDVRKDFLEGGMTHRWELSGVVDDLVTIAVAAAPSLDVTLELVNSDQVSLGTSSSGLLGETETLEELELPTTGDYEIVVRSVGITSGDYALLIQTDDSLPFIVMRDNIIYGGGSSGTIPADSDHFWHFVGEDGDVISITLSPVGQFDLVLYLIGPNGLELEFVDDTGVEGDDAILNYQLPDDGYYSVGVGEVQFDEANYVLTLDKVQ